jgi:hypothetical protein
VRQDWKGDVSPTLPGLSERQTPYLILRDGGGSAGAWELLQHQALVKAQCMDTPDHSLWLRETCCSRRRGVRFWPVRFDPGLVAWGLSQSERVPLLCA